MFMASSTSDETTTPQGGNRGNWSNRGGSRSSIFNGQSTGLPSYGEPSRGGLNVQPFRGPSFGVRTLENGQSSRGGRPFGDQAARGGRPFGDQAARGDSAFENGQSSRGGRPFGDQAARGGRSFGDQAARGDSAFENGQSSRGGRPFGDQAARGGRPFGDQTSRNGPSFGDRPFENGQSSRGGATFGNGHSCRGGSTFGHQAYRHRSSADDDQASQRSSPYNVQSSRDAPRAYPVATLTSKGQIEFKPPPPVAIQVTAEDKEEFGEEIGNKLASHTIPRIHAEMGFAPKTRDVADIYHDDEKHADEYASVIDEDDDVEVIGFSGGDLVLIDNWAVAGFQDKLYENIKRAKYIRPRKIQCSALPLILDNYDLRVKAETGSGKTLSFLLPIIEECMIAKKKNLFASEPCTPFAVILAPTRELIIQTFEQACKLADGTGIFVARAYGEYNVKKNQKELAGGCDIVCATPGRFLHFVQEKSIKLDKVRFIVFDEADKLLTDVFQKTIDSALFECEPKLCEVHQTLFFSATFDDDLILKSERYMRRDCIVSLQSKDTAPTKKVVQEFRLHVGQYKFAGIRNFFVEELEKVDGDAKKLPRTFIFCKTGQYSERLAVALEEHGVPSIPMNGLRAQDLREDALTKFRENVATVLISTDLCSRGIDIKDADLVINVDLPDDYDTYVHRVGRCGRIRHGRCISFVSREADLPLLLKIKQVMETSGQIVPPSLEEILRPKDGPKTENQNNKDASVNVDSKAVESSVSSKSGAEEEQVQKQEENVPSIKDVDKKVEESVADVSTKDAHEEKEPGGATHEHSKSPIKDVDEMKSGDAELDVSPEQAKLPIEDDDDENDW